MLKGGDEWAKRGIQVGVFLELAKDFLSIREKIELRKNKKMRVGKSGEERGRRG